MRVRFGHELSLEAPKKRVCPIVYWRSIGNPCLRNSYYARCSVCQYVWWAELSQIIIISASTGRRVSGSGEVFESQVNVSWRDGLDVRRVACGFR